MMWIMLVSNPHPVHSFTEPVKLVCLQSRVDSQRLTQDVVSEGHKSQAHTEAFLSDTTTRNGKLDMYWPDSLGHLEYAAPSSKQFIGGDSIGLDGLIANRLDAFQNFSNFQHR